MPKRRGAEPFPIEAEILIQAQALALSGQREFHGYELTKAIVGQRADGSEVGHGSVYRALGRLETMGWLDSEWEDAQVAEAAGRPRRRLYHLTPTGAVTRSSAMVRGDTGVVIDARRRALVRA